MDYQWFKEVLKAGDNVRCSNFKQQYGDQYSDILKFVGLSSCDKRLIFTIKYTGGIVAASNWWLPENQGLELEPIDYNPYYQVRNLP